MFGLLQRGNHRAHGICHTLQPLFGRKTGSSCHLGGGNLHDTGKITQNGGVKPCQHDRRIFSRLYPELGMKFQFIRFQYLHLTREVFAQVAVPVVQGLYLLAYRLPVLRSEGGE